MMVKTSRVILKKIYRQTLRMTRIKRMKNKFTYYFIIALLFAYGCSNTKYLPEGEMLYVGGEVKVQDTVMKRKARKNMEKELEGLLRPRPNRAILGLRPKLWIYNIAG